jgi:hypothetical protein
MTVRSHDKTAKAVEIVCVLRVLQKKPMVIRGLQKSISRNPKPLQHQNQLRRQPIGGDALLKDGSALHY